MSTRPKSKTEPPQPAPAKTYGRAKCKNCDRRFIKERPNQVFCKWLPDGTRSQCKAEFHRNGSAFGQLKGRIEGFIREQTKDLRKKVAELERVVIAIQNQKPDQPF